MLIVSCEDLIEVGNPRTQLTRDIVFEDDLTATAAVSGLYSGLTSYAGGFGSVSYLGALSSDEMIISGESEVVEFYQNEVLSTNTSVTAIWNSAYREIYKANLALEALNNSVHITQALKYQLRGEAKFLRAFHHFYLVNLFGAVPYLTSTDYETNGTAHRMPLPDVYQQIVADLLDAKTLLVEDYSHSKAERVRANKWTAAALLARTYLYNREWVLAEEQASTVISRISLYSLTDLDKTFLKNSSETIWQLIPPNSLPYTVEGSVFNRPIYSPEAAVISEDLYNAFEPGDYRRNVWVRTGTNNVITWHYPAKYKETHNNATGLEYSTVFRLAEVYLIRAEARAQQGKLTGIYSAEADLNVIRNRSGLSNTTASTEMELLAAIAHERRVELFVEWGHRWLDLKRTGDANSVLPQVKPEWDDTDDLYPIPFSELQLNPNLIQNDGY